VRAIVKMYFTLTVEIAGQNRCNLLTHRSIIMATLDLDENSSTYQVRSYQPGRIQINEAIYSESIIITPHTLIEHWQPQTVAAITTESLQPLLELKPDILLIGTGAELVFLALSLYGDLINHGIGVEIMDSSAAARTFNALSAEGRNVAAALIIR